MNDEEEEALKEEMVECMFYLHGRGLITGISGNASIRLPGTEEIWITPGRLYRGAEKHTSRPIEFMKKFYKKFD